MTSFRMDRRQIGQLVAKKKLDIGKVARRQEGNCATRFLKVAQISNLVGQNQDRISGYT